MSIDWRARRERAQRNRPPKDTACKHCWHAEEMHVPTMELLGKPRRCIARITVSDEIPTRVKPCECTGYEPLNQPTKTTIVAAAEDCVRCDHSKANHFDISGRETRCMLVVEPSDDMKECYCTGFITPDSICTCGHRFSEHDEHDDCCSSWCHCDKFSEAPP